MKNAAAPPSWMQRLLSSLLPARDRDAVAGDLYEEFCERKLPDLGSGRATFWYFRQVLSFAPSRMRSSLVQPTLLGLLCGSTAMCGCWLGLMELVLKHPGYASREWISGTIVAEALLTVCALRFGRSLPLRAVAMVGSLALFWLAGTALLATANGAHPEGYVLLIALALILQGCLTLSTFTGRDARPRQSA